MATSNDRVVSEALHWIWSWNVQLDRLYLSTKAEWNMNQTEISSLESEKICSRTSLDEHLLLVVGRNVLRAIDCLPPHLADGTIPTNTREALNLLRNIYEHWDEQRAAFENPGIPKTRSGKCFSKKYPNGILRSITYAQDDFYIGGVVGLKSFSNQLSELAHRLLDESLA